jgi:hypothetical protein
MVLEPTQIMAGSSSTTPMLSNPISEKLMKGNHAVWKAQILAVLHGARLVDHVTSAIQVPPEKIKEEEMIPNPTREEWYATNSRCNTAASTWDVIESMFTSGTRDWSINTRIALATMRKENDSIIELKDRKRRPKGE